MIFLVYVHSCVYFLLRKEGNGKELRLCYIILCYDQQRHSINNDKYQLLRKRELRGRMNETSKQANRRK